MPKLDHCQEKVRVALMNEGWIVPPKSVFLTDKYRNDVYIDLAARRTTNGTGIQQIYVEVKCFKLPKDTAGFHRAIGQYITYRGIIERIGLSVPLFLAVPSHSFGKYFNEHILALMVQQHIHLIKVDFEEEKVLEWIIH